MKCSLGAHFMSDSMENYVNRRKQNCAHVLVRQKPFCASMVTHCRLYFGSCSLLKASYRTLYLGVAAYTRGMAQAFAVTYALSDVAQSRNVRSRLQLWQVVCCMGVVCTSSFNAVVAWLAIFASVCHALLAALLMDLHNVGDCRRCCNEAHQCVCGSKKDPLPPGSLRHLVRLIETQYSEHV